MPTTATMQPDQSTITHESASASTQTIMVPGINVWLYGPNPSCIGAHPQGTILLVFLDHE